MNTHTLALQWTAAQGGPGAVETLDRHELTEALLALPTALVGEPHGAA